MPGRMTEEEINAYLDSTPAWIILSTIDHDGFPHSVPLGYFRLGDEIYVNGHPHSRRVKNIERNPHVCLLLESGVAADRKGVLIQGEATIIREPAEVLRLSREMARWFGTPEEQLPTEPRPGLMYIRVQRTRVASWDFSKG